MKARLRAEHRALLTCCIALAVVLCIFAALSRPGSAMTNPEEQMDCPFEVHAHTAECLDEAGNLICGKADFAVHTHTELCYDGTGALCCTLPEIEAHEHDASCWQEEQVLACGLDTAPAMDLNQDLELDESELHEHTGDCYETVATLVCDKPEIILHTHNDACFDETGALACGQTEVLEHVHDLDCFVIFTPDGTDEGEPGQTDGEPDPAEDNSDLTDGEPDPAEDEPGQLDGEPEDMADPAGDALDGGEEIAPIAEEGTDEIPLTPADRDGEKGIAFYKVVDNKYVKIEENDKIDTGEDYVVLRLLYEIQGEADSGKDYSHFYYQLPEGVRAPETITPTQILDPVTKTPIGSFTVNADGKVIVTFNEGTVKKLESGGKVENAYLEFDVQFPEENWEDIEKNGLDFSEDYTFHFQFTNQNQNEQDLAVGKEITAVDETAGTLTYEVTIKSAGGTAAPVTLEDVMEHVELNGDGSFTVTKKNGETTTPLNPGDNTDNNYSVTAPVDGAAEFRMTLPKMDPGDEYIITYNAKLPDAEWAQKDKADVEAHNTVTARSKNWHDEDLEDTAEQRRWFHKSTSKHNISVIKSSEKVTNEKGEEEIEWTITILNPKGVDLAGYKLSDIFNNWDLRDWDITEITINGETIPVPSKENDPNSIYVFPDNSNEEKYEIVYTTPAIAAPGTSGATNTATLTGDGESIEGKWTEDVGDPGNQDNQYNLLEKEAISLVENGDGTATITWKITLDLRGGVKKDANLNEDPWSGNGYNGSEATTPQRFTVEQQEAFEQAVQDALAKIDIQAFQTDNDGKIVRDENGRPIPRDCKSVPTNPDEGTASWGLQDTDGMMKFMNINFLKDIPPDADREPITIEFTTTAALNGGKYPLKFTNACGLSGMYARAEINYSLTLVKQDDRNRGQETSYHFLVKQEDTETLRGDTRIFDWGRDKYTLDWYIDVMVPDHYTKGDLTLTDTLPEGTTLDYIRVVAIDWNIPEDERAFKNEFDLYRDGKPIPEENTWEYNGGLTVEVAGQKENGQTVTIVIPEAVAKKIQKNGETIHIRIRAEFDPLDETYMPHKEGIPDDDKRFEGSFENIVTLTGENGIHADASQTQVVTRNENESALSKTGTQKKTEDGIITNVVAYSIDVNPEARQLLPLDPDANATLELEDVLSYDSNIGITAQYVPGSLHVYNAETNEEVPITLSELPKPRPDPAHQNRDKCVLKFDIPDKTHLTVVYEYEFVTSSLKVIENPNITNTVKLNGSDQNHSTDSGTNHFEIQPNRGGATTSGPKLITLVKVDSENVLTVLPGAEFEVQYYDENGQWTDLPMDSAAATDDDGKIELPLQDYNVLHRYRETAAPTGYTLDSEWHYFYVASEAMKFENVTDVDGSAIQPEKLTQIKPGEYLTLTNEKSASLVLPKTGGSGVAGYWLGGLLMMAGAAYLLLYRRTKRGKKPATL